MKYFIFIFIFFNSQIIQSQNSNSDKKIYYYKYCYVKAVQDEKELFYKPWARDVTITYDEFLKSIEIISTDTENIIGAVRLKFMSNSSNGFWLMKDNNDVKYYVLNKLENKIFMYVLAEKKDGIMFSFEMTNNLKTGN